MSINNIRWILRNQVFYLSNVIIKMKGEEPGILFIIRNIADINERTDHNMKEIPWLS